MPFGVTAAVTSGLIAAGVGEVTAGILAAGLVSAGTGALIGGATAALTGGNIGKGALYGGLGGAVTGGIGGALGGAGGGAASAADEAAFMAGDDAADAAAGVSGAGSVSGLGGGAGGLGSQVNNAAAGINNLSNIGSNAASNVGTFGQDLSSLNVAPAAQSAAPSSSGGILDWLGKGNNLKTVASLGNTGLSLAQALNPKTVNPQATADAARAAAGMNGNLSKYTLQSTSTPYTGNWYTYGQTPQAPMYSASLQPVAQKQGGLVGYAHGGKVRGYAMGGMLPQAASPLTAMLPQSVPSQNPAMAAKPPINPLATHNGFAIGKALGQHLKATGKLHNLQTPKDAFQVGHAIGSKLATGLKPAFSGDGRVPGQGGGQADTVHAKLSKDEFVIPAEVVSQLGDGSSEHGGKVLEQFIHNIREQKTKNRGKFPPKARNPLSYLPKGALA